MADKRSDEDKAGNGHVNYQESHLVSLHDPDSALNDSPDVLEPPLDSEGGKHTLEAYQSALNSNGLKRTLEAYQSALNSNGLKRTLEAYQSALNSNGLKRTLEAYQSALNSNGLKRTLEAYQSALNSDGLKRTLEAYQSVLAGGGLKAYLSGLEGIGLQRLDNQGQAVQAILRELHSRDINTEGLEDPTAQSEVASSITISDHYTGVVLNSGNTAWRALPTVVLIILLNFLSGWFLLLSQWEDVRQGLVDLNARLPQTQSFGQLREFIRIELAGKPGDIRVVTGSNVRLRAEPSMKSDVLLLLPSQAVVVVLEKENRTWRYVSYNHDGYMIDGYVSTKLLKKVRR